MMPNLGTYINNFSDSEALRQFWRVDSGRLKATIMLNLRGVYKYLLEKYFLSLSNIKILTLSSHEG